MFSAISYPLTCVFLFFVPQVVCTLADYLRLQSVMAKATAQKRFTLSEASFRVEQLVSAVANANPANAGLITQADAA